MDDTESESVEHASLGVLRDLWEVRFGKKHATLPVGKNFWFTTATRLYYSGWCTRMKASTRCHVFQLKEPVK